ncbi:uncharacterized protein LOC106468700 isoform X2 [Limulus polyphemus]|uniref:Uncharacterized protein LOC106468700 isoform X2 n=1 Tax=Limulus polyphemus TaxID=6850 RepID=A0ABM1BLT9_LIMPO|nr:uncharacterized protein LOC106468700 isoform X2 [Limulus polyphemus]
MKLRLAGSTLLVFWFVFVATAAPNIQENKTVAEKSNSSETKEKRSEENIMFGNQQNKPSATTDDFPKNSNKDGSESTDGEETSTSSTEEQTDKRSDEEKLLSEDEQDEKYNSNKNLDVFGYLDTPSVLSVTNPYGGEPYGPEPDRTSGPLLGTDVYDEYSQYRPYDYRDAIYRRKRSYMRKRSLRDNMEEMLDVARRFPRRAMRLKRHTDVAQILKWLDALNQEKQYEVPYQEQHPLTANEEENSEMAYSPDSGPLPAFYSGSYAYNTPDTDEEVIEPEIMWKNPYREISMARRSYPYPTDYRYFMLPSQKRSSPPSSFDDDGQWDQISKQLYDNGNSKDLERLYVLANLLSDEDSEREFRYRRSAYV